MVQNRRARVVVLTFSEFYHSLGFINNNSFLHLWLREDRHENELLQSRCYNEWTRLHPTRLVEEGTLASVVDRSDAIAEQINQLTTHLLENRTTSNRGKSLYMSAPVGTVNFISWSVFLNASILNTLLELRQSRRIPRRNACSSRCRSWMMTPSTPLPYRLWRGTSP